MRSAFKRATVLGITVLTAVTPVVVATPSNADTRVIGTVQMGANSRLSAAIYDERGQLVRHLYDLAPRSGTVQLKWDGKDNEGYDVPKGKYNWRAATSGVVGSYDGHVGDLGQPEPGYAFERNENPGNPTAVAYGPNGDLYTTSRYEETGVNVRGYAPADILKGKQKWLAATGFDERGHAVAADDKYVYNAGWAGIPNNANYFYRIYRHRTDNGRTEQFTSGQPIELKKDWKTGDPVFTGLAVDATHLWVLDTALKQIRVFDKVTGVAAPILGGQTSMQLTEEPRGIVTDGAGQFWVTIGNEARRYTYDATAKNLKQTDSIKNLAHPYGLAWDRSGGKSILYVSEVDTGNIKRYNLALGLPLPVLPQWPFSNMDGAGLVSDTTFGWKYDTGSAVPGGDAAIAVSPDGKTLAVVDYWNGRTLFYDTATGTAKTERLQGNNNPQPDVDVAAGEQRMTSQSYEYEIKPGTPWRLNANWKPTDDPKSEYTASTSVLRKINGNEYLYVFVNHRCTVANNQNCGGYDPGTFAYGGVLIYRLNTQGPGRGMKRIASIRKLIPDPGPRTPDETKNKHLTITNDTNGDGILDPDNTRGDTVEDTSTKGYILGNPGVSVDSHGTIWFANAASLVGTTPHSGVARMKVSSFDAQGDPVYRLDDPAHRTEEFTVLDETSYDVDLGTRVSSAVSQQTAYDVKNERLYTTVDTTEFNPFANNGGNAVRIVDLKADRGKTQSVISGFSRQEGPLHLLRDSVTGLAVDNEGFYYTGGNSGEGQRISMHTWDGLPVARAFTPLPTYSPGWFDRGQSLTAFKHSNGIHYAYAQDNGYGTNQRYAFSNVTSVRRVGSDPGTGSTLGAFDWPGTTTANDLIGWWRLDAGRSNARYVADSLGGGHWGLYEQLPEQPNWWHRFGSIDADGAYSGSLSFTGNNAVNFGQESRGGKPDTMADNPDNPALSVGTWFKTKASGVLFSYQNVWLREVANAPRPTASVPALYVGQDGKLYGGALTAAGCATPQMISPAAVNDGGWHHAALVATKTGQTLYLDGKPVGSTSCGRVTGGLNFTILGKGYTTRTGGTWPSTPGGYFGYNGSLDDVRMYRKELSTADIQALATAMKPSGPLAHWKFDEPSGTVAADASDHGKEATVSGGTWQPQGGRNNGGAIAFDGSTTRVTVPNTMTTFAPESIAVWVKTTKGGPVLGDQRGEYPTKMVANWLGSGVAERPYNDTIRISENGSVTTKIVSVELSGRPKAEPKSMVDGAWHHIVVTAEPRRNPNPFPGKVNEPIYTSTLYIDGEQVAQGPAAPTDQGGQSKMRPHAQFGAAKDQNENWSYFNGLLDDAKIYDRVLTAEEVKQLYTS